MKGRPRDGERPPTTTSFMGWCRRHIVHRPHAGQTSEFPGDAPVAALGRGRHRQAQAIAHNPLNRRVLVTVSLGCPMQPAIMNNLLVHQPWQTIF